MRVFVKREMCLHGALCSIPFNFIYKMTMFWKRSIWNFWSHLQWRGGGGGLRVNISYHAAAIVIPLNVTCNATMTLKMWILTPGSARGSIGKIFAALFLQSSFCLIWYAKWPCMFWKNWILIPRVGRGWQRAKYLLPWCCVHNSL